METITLHNKLKEAIREINRIFSESKSEQDKRYLQELMNYINQYEGDIDLLMCQMQYEPKVKETILFSPVTTDILDRMNLILHQVRTLAKQISSDDHLNDQLDEETSPELSTIPNKATYIIKIQTNNQSSSSLSDDANVSIKLYGTYNKSPDVRLIQSIGSKSSMMQRISIVFLSIGYWINIPTRKKLDSSFNEISDRSIVCRPNQRNRSNRTNRSDFRRTPFK